MADDEAEARRRVLVEMLEVGLQRFELERELDLRITPEGWCSWAKFLVDYLDERGVLIPGRAFPESFTCPRCGAQSYHPVDIQEGYCGRCRDWTGVLDGR